MGKLLATTILTPFMWLELCTELTVFVESRMSIENILEAASVKWDRNVT